MHEEQISELDTLKTLKKLVLQWQPESGFSFSQQQSQFQQIVQEYLLLKNKNSRNATTEKGFEFGVFCNSDGSQRFILTSSKEENISISKRVLERIRLNRNDRWTFYHTHPFDAPLSPPDIILALELNLEAIYAFLPNGGISKATTTFDTSTLPEQVNRSFLQQTFILLDAIADSNRWRACFPKDFSLYPSEPYHAFANSGFLYFMKESSIINYSLTHEEPTNELVAKLDEPKAISMHVMSLMRQPISNYADWLKENISACRS